MTHGGKRPGAGRKKGSKANHTFEAEKARALIMRKLFESLEPIIDKAIEQAKLGNHQAREWLSDRAMGRVPTAIEVPNGSGEIIIRWKK